MAQDNKAPEFAIGVTSKTDMGGRLRGLRCDDDGYLEVIAGGAAPMDVNLAEVAGTATVEAGINGVQAIGGTQAAETAADDGSFPVKVGAIVRDVLTAITVGQVTNFLADSLGRLWVRTAGYDSATDSIKESTTNGIQTDYDPSAQVVANVTNVAIATYYPSPVGLPVGDRNFLTFLIQLRDGTFDIEVSEDQTTWSPAVTGQLTDNEDGKSGYNNTHYADIADAATVVRSVDWQGCGHLYFRMLFTPGAVTPGTNVFVCQLVQRASAS